MWTVCMRFDMLSSWQYGHISYAAVVATAFMVSNKVCGQYCINRLVHHSSVYIVGLLIQNSRAERQSLHSWQKSFRAVMGCHGYDFFNEDFFRRTLGEKLCL